MGCVTSESEMCTQFILVYEYGTLYLKATYTTIYTDSGFAAVLCAVTMVFIWQLALSLAVYQSTYRSVCRYSVVSFLRILRFCSLLHNAYECRIFMQNILCMLFWFLVCSAYIICVKHMRSLWRVWSLHRRLRHKRFLVQMSTSPCSVYLPTAKSKPISWNLAVCFSYSLFTMLFCIEFGIKYSGLNGIIVTSHFYGKSRTTKPVWAVTFKLNKLWPWHYIGKVWGSRTQHVLWDAIHTWVICWFRRCIGHLLVYLRK